MKITFYFSFLFFLLLTDSDVLNNESNEISCTKTVKSFIVTFNCDSCTKRNKFFISGLEKHTFKEAKFPLEIKLKSGSYKMTYWQNKVRQIHLPFAVSADSKNIITVKD